MKPHAGLNVPKEFEDLYDINNIPDIPQPPWPEEPDTHLAAIEADPRDQTLPAWREAWQNMTPLERRRTTLRYYANCSWLDSYFGQVLDKLEKLGRLGERPDRLHLRSRRDARRAQFPLQQVLPLREQRAGAL